MTERKNSVEQVREQFMEDGGIFLGQKEWDKILTNIEALHEKCQKDDPLSNYYGYDFVGEVFKAGARKTGHTMVDGKWTPFYFETYIRRNPNGYYSTLVEANGECIERMSEKSEVVGYLTWKLLNGEISFKDACKELRYNDL